MCLGGKYACFPDKSGFSLRYNRPVPFAGLVYVKIFKF